MHSRIQWVPLHFFDLVGLSFTKFRGEVVVSNSVHFSHKSIILKLEVIAESLLPLDAFMLVY